MIQGEVAAEATIATEEELASFGKQSSAEVSPSLLGVLAETALTGRQRYEWTLLCPLLHAALDRVFEQYRAEEGKLAAEVADDAEVGPPRPPPPPSEGGATARARQELHAALDDMEGAPFTLQRLCELLVEPREQYDGLDKLARALARLLTVTSTLMPSSEPGALPRVAELTGVNANPPSPYLTPGCTTTEVHLPTESRLPMDCDRQFQTSSSDEDRGLDLADGGMPQPTLTIAAR